MGDVIPIHLADAPGGAAHLSAAGSFDLWGIFSGATIYVQAIIVLLVAASLASWAIIFYKLIVLSRAQSESLKFLEAFWTSKRLEAIYKEAGDLKHSSLAALFKAGYVELSKLRAGKKLDESSMVEQLGDIENVERSLRRAQTVETTYLERLVSFLATTGASTPFVGLLGTVIGIMFSFHEIGEKKTASLAVVGPGITEALFATAVGLFAAIPAVIAYNYFTNRVRVLASEMDTFSQDFLNIVKRHFLK